MVYAAVVAIAAVVAAHFLIAAGAEGLIAGAGQNNDADAVVVTGVGQRVEHLFDRLRAKRIAHLRPVDGDFGDAVGGLVIQNVFEIAGAILPGDGGIQLFFIRIKHVRFL